MQALVTHSGLKVWTFDIEVFPNFFMAHFSHGAKASRTFIIYGKRDDRRQLFTFIRDNQKVFAGFNSFSYDEVVLKWMLSHQECTTQEIYECSKAIIESQRMPDHLFKLQYGRAPWAYSIDLFQLLNKKGSLKEWMCREGATKVVESAASFTEDLPAHLVEQVINYCKNDTNETQRILTKNWHLVLIRDGVNRTYDIGSRVYVQGDAGLAQSVFMKLHKDRSNEWASKVRDKAAATMDNKCRKWQLSELICDRIKFTTPEFKSMLAAVREAYVIGDKTGAKWQFEDKNIAAAWELGHKSYKLGVGGLHSVDGPAMLTATFSEPIIDLDVTSYYPSIIIEENLYPEQIGPSFVDDMRGLRDTRVKAKATGDKLTNEMLKIVINSTFGKLNDAYSPLRSIPNAMRVTINGQLELLMLVEMLHVAGAIILSANTDGVTISWTSIAVKEKLGGIVQLWQKATGHTLEQAYFKKYCRRDVNTYIALKADGEVKYKGDFNPYPLTGKWDGFIVKKACEQFLLHDIHPIVTVRACKKATDFLFYQRVQNGGHVLHGEEHLGKIVRWYVSKKGKQLYRFNPDKTKVKIPGGANAMLAMDITDWDVFGIPDDVDYDYYAAEAMALANSTRRKK